MTNPISKEWNKYFQDGKPTILFQKTLLTNIIILIGVWITLWIMEKHGFQHTIVVIAYLILVSLRTILGEIRHGRRSD